MTFGATPDDAEAVGGRADDARDVGAVAVVVGVDGVDAAGHLAGPVDARGCRWRSCGLSAALKFGAMSGWVASMPVSMMPTRDAALAGLHLAGGLGAHHAQVPHGGVERVHERGARRGGPDELGSAAEPAEAALRCRADGPGAARADDVLALGDPGEEALGGGAHRVHADAAVQAGDGAAGGADGGGGVVAVACVGCEHGVGGGARAHRWLFALAATPGAVPPTVVTATAIGPAAPARRARAQRWFIGGASRCGSSPYRTTLKPQT